MAKEVVWGTTTTHQDVAHLPAKELLEFHAGLEQNNIGRMMQLLDQEIAYYKDIWDLYDGVKKMENENLYQVIEFFGQSKHQLTIALLSLVRGHIADAMAATRLAIEHAVYADIFMRPDVNQEDLLERWSNRDKGEEGLKRFRDVFGLNKMFPKDNHRLADLAKNYDVCCDGAHPSLAVLGLRSSATPEEIKRSYFDYPEEDKDVVGWYTRAIHSIFRAHVRILDLYHTHLNSQLADPEEWHKKLGGIDKELSERVEQLKQNGWRV